MGSLSLDGPSEQKTKFTPRAYGEFEAGMKYLPVMVFDNSGEIC